MNKNLKNAFKKLEHKLDYDNETELNEEEIVALLNYINDLEEQNKQKDNAIDECIELVNQWKNYCNRQYEDEPCDKISILNNAHWKYCLGQLDEFLEKLHQAKGVIKNEC